MKPPAVAQLAPVPIPESVRVVEFAPTYYQQQVERGICLCLTTATWSPKYGFAHAAAAILELDSTPSVPMAKLEVTVTKISKKAKQQVIGDLPAYALSVIRSDFKRLHSKI